MDLHALFAFRSVAEHGGIGRASRATGQPKTTLSRRLQRLEEELETRLVERGPKVFRLTEEGVLLHERLRYLLAEIEEAGKAVADGFSRPRGHLRVSVPLLFGDLHMGRIAAGFASAYPDIELEILSDDRIIDPKNDGVDVVVRVNPHAREDLVGRLIYRETTVLVASPRLAQIVVDWPDTPALPVVLLPNQAPTSAWTVEGGQATRTFSPRPMMRVSSILMARQAVRNGAGAALLPRTVVEADLRSSALISLGTLVGQATEVWVLHTSLRLRSAKVAAFVSFLCDDFRSPASLD